MPQSPADDEESVIPPTFSQHEGHASGHRQQFSRNTQHLKAHEGHSLHLSSDFFFFFGAVSKWVHISMTHTLMFLLPHIHFPSALLMSRRTLS